MATANIYFVVRHGVREELLLFPNNSSIEDLKLEIYSKFKIKPSKQRIVEFEKDALVDNHIMLSSITNKTLLNVINIDDAPFNLATNTNTDVVDKMNHNMETDKLDNDIETVLKPDMEVTDSLEELFAVMNFIDVFEAIYGTNCNIKFKVHTIREAISDAVDNDKIFMLYLHHNGDIFSKLFCPMLAKCYPIFDYFWILAWDISDNSINKHLKRAVDEVFEMGIVKNKIDANEAGFFVFDIADDGKLLFNEFMSGCIDEENCLSALNALRQKYENAQNNEETSNMAAKSSIKEPEVDFIQFENLMDTSEIEINKIPSICKPTSIGVEPFQNSAQIDEIMEVITAVNTFDNGQRASTDDRQIAAVDNFTSYLKFTHGSCLYQFKEQPLNVAIHEAATLKKIFMLYLHNENDVFSNLFCRLLVKKDLISIFNFYHILVWDITDDNINVTLQRAVLNALKNETVVKFIDNKEAGLFIFERVDEKLELHSRISGSFDDESMMLELYNIHKNLEEKENAKDDMVESRCIASFIYQFENEYGSNHLRFHRNRIHKAIEIALRVEPKSSQKILALYFHNENDKFSKQFCPMLAKGRTRSLLETMFYFLGIDITDQSSHQVLKKTMENEFDLSAMADKIDNEEAAIFFFVSCNDKITLFSYLSTNINEDVLELTLTQICEAVQESHDITDLVEKQVVQKFINTNGSTINGVKCNNAPLQQVIQNQLLSQDVGSRKILMFYLHDPGSLFSQSFLKILKTNAKLAALLRTYFYFLPWDVTNSSLHKSLVSSVRTNFNLEQIETMIQVKESALFFFAASDGIVTLFSMMHDKLKESNLVCAVENLSTSILSGQRVEVNLRGATENDYGPTKFQQLMFDQLGNRDYDCYDMSNAEDHTYLKRKIGFAYFGQPLSDEEGKEYTEKQNKKINKAYKKIIESSKFEELDNEIMMACIFICVTPLPAERLKKKKKDETYNQNFDIVPMPIFVLRKCIQCPNSNACRIIVDHDLRVYKSWNLYLEDNKLHECEMIVPRNGKYSGNHEGSVLIDRLLSPACGTGAQILRIADISSTAVGLGVGAVAMVGLIPAVTLSPIIIAGMGITGIGVGIYSIVRSTIAIVDRVTHDESMHIAESEARGAYFNIIAGSLGFAGAGATTALTYFVRNGAKVGIITRGVVNGINGANLIASGVGLGNSTFDVIYQWVTENRRPTLLTFVQLSSSILFFGHAVYNVRSASTIINETQANTLQEIQGSMRSNRHRKTFEKMRKETVRTTGDTQAGNAEVISYIKNLNNKDEVMATLTRSNKYLNNENVKFSVENGEVKFNGVNVDVQDFGSMSAKQRTQFLTDLPPTPESTPMQTKTVQKYMEKTFNDLNASEVLKEGLAIVVNGTQLTTLVANLINRFSDFVKEKLISFFGDLLMEVCGNVNLNASLCSIFPGSDKYLRLFTVMLNFFRSQSDASQNEYETELQTRQENDANFDVTDYNKSYFGGNVRNTIIWFFEKAVLVATLSPMVILREMLTYIQNWLVRQIYDFTTRRDRQEKRTRSTKRKTKCNTCSGSYFLKET